MSTAKVQRVQNTVYLDNSGQAINGYILYVYLPEYDETLTLNVPNMGESTVKSAVDVLVKQRDALAKFTLPAK
jgi:hypothetical protein